MALVCNLTGMSAATSAVTKRYKHKVTTPEQRAHVACLLALYGWWLAGTSVHPDAWVAWYCSLADGVLPPSLHGVSSQAILDRGRRLVKDGVAQSSLRSWHTEIRQPLYVRGKPVTKGGGAEQFAP